MAEEYREYRRSRNSKKTKQKSKAAFSKKFIRQFLLSLIIFAVICGFRFWGFNNSSRINEIFKNAFTYKIDTSGITQVLEDIIDTATKNSNTEVTTNENTDNSEITQDI